MTKQIDKAKELKLNEEITQKLNCIDQVLMKAKEYKVVGQGKAHKYLHQNFEEEK